MTDFGPNGAAVMELIERASRMTHDEAEQLVIVWYGGWARAGENVWTTARVSSELLAKAHGRADARTQAGAIAWHVARNGGRVAAREAAWALVVRDVMDAEQFDVVYGPWREVMV